MTEPTIVAVQDGKPGCPEMVWDGPYKLRCSMAQIRDGKIVTKPERKPHEPS